MTSRFSQPAQQRRARAKLWMRVDAASHSCATNGQFQHGSQGNFGSTDRQFQLPRKATELLAQSQRCGIHQMRTTDLDDLVPLGGLSASDW